MPFNSLSVNFCPIRGRVSRSPRLAAASSASISLMLSAEYSIATVFGPMPGSRSNSSIVGLYLCSNSSRNGIVPVATRSRILAAMPLPIPGIASSAFGSASTVASVASWVVCCSTASAARR